ncbi:MAG: LapA family protein [Gaiellales bacterium]
MSNLPAKREENDDGISSWKPIALAIIAIYGVVLLIVNSREVKISFVFFNARTSLIFLVLASMAIGAVLGMFGPAWLRRRKRKQAQG